MLRDDRVLVLEPGVRDARRVADPEQRGELALHVEGRRALALDRDNDESPAVLPVRDAFGEDLLDDKVRVAHLEPPPDPGERAQVWERVDVRPLQRPLLVPAARGHAVDGPSRRLRAAVVRHRPARFRSAPMAPPGFQSWELRPRFASWAQRRPAPDSRQSRGSEQLLGPPSTRGQGGGVLEDTGWCALPEARAGRASARGAATDANRDATLHTFVIRIGLVV